MGGRQSRNKGSRALFSVRSASLDSISTSVSLSTVQSTGLPPHSPSMDTICKHSRTGAKLTTKQENGHMYALLETASTDCDSASVQLVPEVNKRDQRRAVRASEEGRRSSERVNGGGKKQTEKSGAAASAVGGSEKTHFTTSLPMEVERHIGRPMSAEGVSSHTVATDVSKRMDSKQTSATKRTAVQKVLPTKPESKTEPRPEDGEMEQVQLLLKSVLKQRKQVSDHRQSHSEDTKIAAQLPEALLQLSPKDLDHLATYLCHKFKDTLQSSLVQQTLQQQEEEQGGEIKPERGATTTTKHVQISEQPVNIGITDGSDSPRNSGGAALGRSGRGSDERVHRRRHKKPRRERPLSTPDMYWKEDPHSNDPTSSSSKGLVHHSSPSPPNESQTHTHSNEECYYHRCGNSMEHTPEASHGCGRRSTCRMCRNCYSPSGEQSHVGVRRKRPGRSKDTPVDVSLDDNCPGVNMVRRRHTHHHHAVCENCLQNMGKVSLCKQNKRRSKQPYSPEMPTNDDLQLSPEDHAARGLGEGTGFITLDQLRTVAKVVKESVGYMDQNLQQQHDRTEKRSSGPPKSQSFRHDRRHQYRVKSKWRSMAVDDCLPAVPKDLHHHHQADDCGDAEASPSTPEELRHFQELVYPTKSRSGRDSPATDMAVIDLSVDSPCMLQPLDRTPDKEPPNSSSSVVINNNSPEKITHLHHHYHHIIHH